MFINLSAARCSDLHLHPGRLSTNPAWRTGGSHSSPDPRSDDWEGPFHARLVHAPRSRDLLPHLCADRPTAPPACGTACQKGGSGARAIYGQRKHFTDLLTVSLLIPSRCSPAVVTAPSSSHRRTDGSLLLFGTYTGVLFWLPKSGDPPSLFLHDSHIGRGGSKSILPNDSPTLLSPRINAVLCFA